MIFPALYALVRRGVLAVPLVGVAHSGWTTDDLRRRAEESIETFGGGVTDRAAFDRLLALLHYVDGDYTDPATFTALRRRPDRLGVANYVRFQFNPHVVIAIGARAKAAGESLVGEARELFLCHDQPDEITPYERLLGEALAGEGFLFAREDGIEEAWRVVDPVLRRPPPVHPYPAGSWGPAAADRIASRHGGWRAPRISRPGDVDLPSSPPERR
jgi:glucose-6-phosphate 1-dehydrogenase